jgi:hypothetical protein
MFQTPTDKAPTNSEKSEHSDSSANPKEKGNAIEELIASIQPNTDATRILMIISMGSFDPIIKLLDMEFDTPERWNTAFDELLCFYAWLALESVKENRDVFQKAKANFDAYWPVFDSRATAYSNALTPPTPSGKPSPLEAPGDLFITYLTHALAGENPGVLATGAPHHPLGAQRMRKGIPPDNKEGLMIAIMWQFDRGPIVTRMITKSYS